MEHKIWKGSFVISALVTVYWFWETFGVAFLARNDPGAAAGMAGFFLVMIGLCTVPIMVLICAFLAKQAFR